VAVPAPRPWRTEGEGLDDPRKGEKLSKEAIARNTLKRKQNFEAASPDVQKAIKLKQAAWNLKSALKLRKQSRFLNNSRGKPEAIFRAGIDAADLWPEGTKFPATQGGVIAVPDRVKQNFHKGHQTRKPDFVCYVPDPKGEIFGRVGLEIDEIAHRWYDNEDEVIRQCLFSEIDQFEKRPGEWAPSVSSAYIASAHTYCDHFVHLDPIHQASTFA
jgi:hypothetical protein